MSDLNSRADELRREIAQLENWLTNDPTEPRLIVWAVEAQLKAKRAALVDIGSQLTGEQIITELSGIATQFAEEMRELGVSVSWAIRPVGRPLPEDHTPFVSFGFTVRK